MKLETFKTVTAINKQVKK